MKYSSGKSLLLVLAFLTPKDDSNRRLLLEISDISRFGELMRELLDVEFCGSCSGKRKSSIAGENDIEKAKKPCSETNSSATGPVSTQVNQTSSARASSVPASLRQRTSASVSPQHRDLQRQRILISLQCRQTSPLPTRMKLT